MRIARIQVLHADGGWRPWTFVRIETEDGLVGWGECSDNRNPLGIAGCVKDLEDLLVGQDPRPIERLYWDMLRRTRQNLGGVTHKAMAGIELARWESRRRPSGCLSTSCSAAPCATGCDSTGPTAGPRAPAWATCSELHPSRPTRTSIRENADVRRVYLRD